jgi:acyl-CoA thioesterase
MSEPTTTVALQDVISGSASPPPCDQLLGIELLYAEPKKAVASWKADDRMINGNGVVMGGYTASASDITIAYAVAASIERNDQFGSIQLDTVFHRPVTAGTIRVEARIKRLGRTVAYVEADLWQNDTLCASSTSIVNIKRGE